MIEVRGLKKRFGNVQALDGVDFMAQPGRITGLIGPNGAGKTTTMRVLAGLVQADAGEALVDGAAAHSFEARRQLGVLSHANGLYPRLTGRENIRYYGDLRRVPRAELDQRLAELVRMLDLSDFCDRAAEGYSEGQRRRIGIARALISGPANLVLDEPTNGLDVTAARALRDAIATLRNQGRSVVLSSHVMFDVESLCDDLYIVRSGKTIWHGTPAELRAASESASAEDGFVKILETRVST